MFHSLPHYIFLWSFLVQRILIRVYDALFLFLFHVLIAIGILALYLITVFDVVIQIVLHLVFCLFLIFFLIFRIVLFRQSLALLFLLVVHYLKLHQLVLYLPQTHFLLIALRFQLHDFLFHFQFMLSYSYRTSLRLFTYLMNIESQRSIFYLKRR